MIDVAYPREREADVVLRDGSTVHLRPVRPEDESELLALFERLDERSRTFRFFTGAANLERTASELADVDYQERFGLLVTRGSDGAPLGHGLYVGLGDGRAEVAFAIAPELQGLGLGTILLAHLAEAALENGYSTLVAEVLPANHRMVDVFRESGFPVEVRAAAESLIVEFPTSLDRDAVARFEERDSIAARAAVRSLLEPRAVAVVGASRHDGEVGHEVLRNLIASGFAGPIYAVNPAAKEVCSVLAVPSVAAIDGTVDLAVIAVPAAQSAAVARECAAKGVRSLVVLSAGFAESGEEGGAREQELLRICRQAGMRLVGPNCLGVLRSGAHGFDATFALQPPPAGDVGFVSQSGALGLALIELAGACGLGISSFVSVGNRADLTANDLLEYWEEDEATRVALLYLESFSDPRRFARVARRFGRRKPIVVVKSGRSAAGARAAASHTGAILAASDRATDALFEQAGVIRAESLGELLDVASLVSRQPLPTGRRVAVLTNAGGPGIMCADACAAAGLEVPELPPETRSRLRQFLPGEAALANPVDMIATAGPDQYRRAIEVLRECEGVDALIAIFIQPIRGDADAVAAAIRDAASAPGRLLTMQAVLMSESDAAGAAAGVPAFRYPEDASKTLAKVAAYAEWRRRPLVPASAPADLRSDEAAAILAEALAEDREWLSPRACERLLDCYGIPLAASKVSETPLAAGAAAAQLGGAVALKATGPEIVHKSEIGAVELGLHGAVAVAAAAREMDCRLKRQGLRRESFLVQEMRTGSVELLVGISSDPVFGPVLACGAGGTAAELIGDLGVRICPLDGDDPRELLDSLRIRPLLAGYRGSPPCDIASLEDLVARVGFLAERHAEIAELDLNPVIAGPDGAVAVDARVRVRSAPPHRPWPRTWD